MHMKFITRDTDCAMRALTFLSRHADRAWAARALAKEIGVARPFLRKILQRLGRAGFLVSTRGRKGGFALGRSAGKILMKDLILLFQGNLTIAHCNTSSGACGNRKTCLVHRRLKNVETRFQVEIGLLSIRQLAAAQEQ
jgi:Rrf2 family transcriptional regulator, nitric oxide-sensitive transcriptional repressor